MINAPTIEVKGVNGQLIITDGKVIISRKGFFAFINHGLKGEKEILIKSISAIQFKKPGIVNGYIQFVFMGSQESKRGLFDAGQDENTVIFSNGQLKDFERVKNLIESQIKNIGRVYSGSATPQAQSHGLDDLEKLSQLKDKGIITEEEFVLKKKQILGI